MSNKFAPDFAHFDPLSAARQSLGPVARTYGRKRVISGNFEAAITDLEANDVLMLCPIRSSAVLHSLKISNDDLDSVAGLSLDFGVCDKDGADVNTGAGDSRELLRTATAQGQGAVLPSAAVEQRFVDASQNVVDGVGAQIWEMVNLQTAGIFAADPNRLWFICIRVEVVAATPLAGTIGYQVEYTLD